MNLSVQVRTTQVSRYFIIVEGQWGRENKLYWSLYSSIWVLYPLSWVEYEYPSVVNSTQLIIKKIVLNSSTSVVRRSLESGDLLWGSPRVRDQGLQEPMIGCLTRPYPVVFRRHTRQSLCHRLGFRHYRWVSGWVWCRFAVVSVMGGNHPHHTHTLDCMRF